MPDFNKKSIESYWVGLNLQKPMVGRLTYLIEQAESILIEPIIFIFVENVITADGNQQFPNLALFTGRGWLDLPDPYRPTQLFPSTT
jgi:hypothetical protein